MTSPSTTAFRQFKPDSSYPRPKSTLSTQNTNSWYQNLIGNIPDHQRYVKAFPWWFNPNYDENPSSNWAPINFTNVTIKKSLGNLEVTSQPSTGITQDSQSLRIDQLERYSFRISQIVDTNDVFTYVSPGSPFLTMEYVEASLNWIPYQNYTKISLMGPAVDLSNANSSQKIKIDYNQTTTSVEEVLLRDGIADTRDLNFHDPTKPGLPPTTPIKGTYKNVSKVATFEFLDYKFLIDGAIGKASSTQGTSLGPVSNLKFIGQVLGVNFSKNKEDKVNYGAEFVLDGNNYALKVETLPKNHEVIFNAIVTQPKSYIAKLYLLGRTNIDKIKLEDDGNNGIKSDGKINGYVQMVNLDSTFGFNQLESLYDSKYGLFRTNLSVKDFSDTGWTYESTVTTVVNQGSDTPLILFPGHYKKYNFADANRLSQIYGFEDLTYGQFQFYEAKDVFDVKFANKLNPPLVPDLKLNQCQKKAMDDIITREIIQVYRRVAPLLTGTKEYSNPYTYGQNAAAAAQYLFLATSNGFSSSLVRATIQEGNNTINLSLNTVMNQLIQGLKDWLDNNNTPASYRLSYEPIYGGIIVPADADTTNNTAYGNSYYNDHHFHYGYFFYAIYLIIKMEGQNEFIGYYDRIVTLLYDVVNPGDDNITTFNRHKDWYHGHSWATGIPFRDRNGGVAIQANRQQESSSEAINCYYSAWLLSQQISNLTLNNDIARVSIAALTTEIDARTNYYLLQGDSNAKVGAFKNVATIGIIEFFGKGVTLDWNMQPNSYRGRIIGINGIQSIPFTEISNLTVSKDWSNSLSTTKDLYRMEPNLIVGLTNDSYTPVYPEYPFDPSTEGGFWGNVGLMLLAPGDYDDSKLRQAWKNLLNKQGPTTNNVWTQAPVIKNFDTFTNTLYWLIKNEVFNESNNGGFTASGSLMLGSTKIKYVYKQFLLIDIFKPDFCSKKCCKEGCYQPTKDQSCSTGYQSNNTSKQDCSTGYKPSSNPKKKPRAYNSQYGYYKDNYCDKTRIIVDLSAILGTECNSDIVDKIIKYSTTSSDLVEYSVLKVTLVYLSGYRINPEQILDPNNDTYIREIIRDGPYCNFLRLLDRLVDQNHPFE